MSLSPPVVLPMGLHKPRLAPTPPSTKPRSNPRRSPKSTQNHAKSGKVNALGNVSIVVAFFTSFGTPLTFKIELPYKREHVFTAAQDVDISPAGRPSFRWRRPSFRVTWPLISARTALGWQPGGPGRPTQHTQITKKSNRFHDAGHYRCTVAHTALR